jgi:hypothetical protein
MIILTAVEVIKILPNLNTNPPIPETKIAAAMKMFLV